MFSVDALFASFVRSPTMLFVVRGKTPDHHDRILRIEADSLQQARPSDGRAASLWRKWSALTNTPAAAHSA